VSQYPELLYANEIESEVRAYFPNASDAEIATKMRDIAEFSQGADVELGVSKTWLLDRIREGGAEELSGIKFDLHLWRNEDI
jgi:hypothetical protein